MGACTDMAERLRKKRKIERDDESYIDTKFILGSSSGNIQVDSRQSMTPQMLESLVYLRANERFWDDQLIGESINAARSDRSERKLLECEIFEDE